MEKLCRKYSLKDIPIPLFNFGKQPKIAIGPTLKNCLFPITCIVKRKVTWTTSKTFFYLIQTKYYFLSQMLPSP